MKKIKLVLASLLAVIFGCGSFYGCSTTRDYILIWANDFWGGDNEFILQQVTKDWNAYAKANNKKQMKYVVLQDMNNTINTSNVNGTIADIVIWDRWQTVRYAKQGIFQDMNSYMEDAGYSFEDFMSSPLSEFLYNGKYYGLPLDVDVWGFFVNRDKYLAWANGVNDASVKEWLINPEGTDKTTVSKEDSYFNYPETWDQFYTACKGLTVRPANGNKTSITQAGVSAEFEGSVSSWIQTSGGKLVNEEGTDQMLTNTSIITGETSKTYKDAATEMLKYFDKLLGNVDDSTAVTNYNFITSNSIDPFVQQKVVFKLNSLLNGAAFYKKYISKDDGFKFDFMPFPAGPDSESAFQAGKYKGGLIGGYGLTIPKRAQNKSDAWEVIDWWIMNDANYLNWATYANLIPARKSVVEELEKSDSIKSAEYLESALKNVDYYQPRPPVINYFSYETSVQTQFVRQYLERTLPNVDHNSQAAYMNRFFTNIAAAAPNALQFGIM